MTGLAGYNRAFSITETSALRDGAPARRCPVCGNHFVVVEDVWYHYRFTVSGGAASTEVWCSDCTPHSDA